MRYIQLIGLLLLTACGDGGTTPTSPPTPVATSITLSLTSLSFSSLGETSQITATVKDQNGATMSGASVSWSSSSASVATVSSSGLVTAVANGTATITATAGSANGVAAVAVTQAAASMVLSDTAVAFSALGETSQITATLKDQNGNDISGTKAIWTTADASVATISSTGLITAVAEGTVVVSVTLGTLSAEVDVTVLQVPVNLELAEEILNFELLGASVQLTAGAKDGNGYAISDTMISWVTSNKSVATVSGSGVVTTVNGGSAEITVTAGALERTASVSVTVWSAVSSGYTHTCGVNSLGTGYCWGWNEGGQLGDTEQLKTDHSVPTKVSGGHSWQSISAGFNHTCGVTTDGVGYCWGENDSGQLGTGGTTDRLTPTVVKGNHTWRSIVAGNRGGRLFGTNFTCGVTNSDEAYCWGANYYSQLGSPGSPPSLDPILTPALVSGGHKWQSVLPGDVHVCGVTTEGAGYCWGYNSDGQIGDGTISTAYPRSVPTAVSGSHSWESIVAGTDHGCGVTTSDITYCWCDGSVGQIGDGTTDQRSTPKLVTGGHRWNSISTGNGFVCGITTSAEAGCWGYNQFGQLGDGSTTNISVPTAVSGGYSWESLSAGGGLHSCGLTTARALYCWGRDNNGVLGNGLRPSSLIPDAVITPW